MKYYKCDRCTTIIDQGESVSVQIFHEHLASYDLCPSCFKKLVSFLKVSTTGE